MNGIRQALDLLHPGLLLYGEGWTGGASRLAPELSASKGNAARLVQIGFFNDTTRDAIKGDNFQAVHGGYVNGNPGMSEGVRFGLAAAVPHPQVDARRATGGPAWAGYPWHCVNYAASHDNLTLYDKLLASHCAGTDREAMRRTNLAGALVLLAQGIPFMLSGTEFLRSKKGMHNSYNMPDVFNEIDWNRKRIYRHSFDYHAGLIRLRKSHPAFRLTLPEDVRLHMRFLPTPEPVIAFQLRHHAGGDSWGRSWLRSTAGGIPTPFPFRMPRCGTLWSMTRRRDVKRWEPSPAAVSPFHSFPRWSPGPRRNRPLSVLTARHKRLAPDHPAGINCCHKPMNTKEKQMKQKNWLYYLTAFVCGMTVMAVELTCSRLLAPYFSSSSIVWTVIIG